MVHSVKSDLISSFNLTVVFERSNTLHYSYTSDVSLHLRLRHVRYLYDATVSLSRLCTNIASQGTTHEHHQHRSVGGTSSEDCRSCGTYSECSSCPDLPVLRRTQQCGKRQTRSVTPSPKQPQEVGGSRYQDRRMPLRETHVESWTLFSSSA